MNKKTRIVELQPLPDLRHLGPHRSVVGIQLGDLGT
jgi:hypothetical protein